MEYSRRKFWRLRQYNLRTFHPLRSMSIGWAQVLGPTWCFGTASTIQFGIMACRLRLYACVTWILHPTICPISSHPAMRSCIVTSTGVQTRFQCPILILTEKWGFTNSWPRFPRNNLLLAEVSGCTFSSKNIYLFQRCVWYRIGNNCCKAS